MGFGECWEVVLVLLCKAQQGRISEGKWRTMSWLCNFYSPLFTSKAGKKKSKELTKILTGKTILVKGNEDKFRIFHESFDIFLWLLRISLSLLSFSCQHFASIFHLLCRCIKSKYSLNPKLTSSASTFDKLPWKMQYLLMNIYSVYSHLQLIIHRLLVLNFHFTLIKPQKDRNCQGSSSVPINLSPLVFSKRKCA